MMLGAGLPDSVELTPSVWGTTATLPSKPLASAPPNSAVASERLAGCRRARSPIYMAEDAGAADLITGGRLQLGISRGSPEQVIDGWRYFGYQPAEGHSDADMGRRHAEIFLDLLRDEGFAQPNPQPCFQIHQGCCASNHPAWAHLVGRWLERHGANNCKQDQSFAWQAPPKKAGT
jgi:hypothetical protein